MKGWLRYRFARFYYFLKGNRAKMRPARFEFPGIGSIPDFRLPDINGDWINLRNFKGKKLVIVNVASHCGFTPQYKELQEFYVKNADRVQLIGVPCNQFHHQESGTDEEIKNFCEVNFGVTFPLLKKANVKSPDQSELYQWLTNPKLNGWNAQQPVWNFCKYVIDENGFLIAYYPPQMMPEV